MNKMIELEVVNLEAVKHRLYVNGGISSILVNPDAIAEIWPVETVDITRKTSIVNDRVKIGTLDVARVCMMKTQLTPTGDTSLRFITPESYEKLIAAIDKVA